MRIRLSMQVEGIVQGVGFRPFVHRLAKDLGLAGVVGNDTTGVFIEAEGGPRQLEAFRARLEAEAPALAFIERIDSRALPPTGQTGFVIAPSDPGGERQALISPDSATCEDCLAELFDPADRRYLYPFINCTNCGPRFTIVRDVPYDRPNTTMARFAMCATCEREYNDPADRRFHAQPTCCPACGPALSLVEPGGAPLPGDPLEASVALLRQGKVVAIKGLGGYHLAARAFSERATAALRSRKHREDKPFAVMVADVAAAGRLCEVGPLEQGILTSQRRPIVLLRRRAAREIGRVGETRAADGSAERPEEARIAPAVAPGNCYLGLMLPYTALHHLLARDLGEPFVLTSGNVSDEPIAYDDSEARSRLAHIADAFLTHDRPIHMRTDDSVTRVARGREAVLRRSRGFVPQPVIATHPFPRPLLACGAELKNTFCLAKGRRAFVSHHIGDLENYETLRSFTEGIEHFSRLFEVRPEVVAHDLHPEYLSTKYALDLEGVELVGVQHHHAHIASCLVDNGEAGPAIGVAFDGLGYGSDGMLWGGEILVTDLVGFRRIGHLQPIAMPGGVAAIREPWRMAAAYLDLAFEGDVPSRVAPALRERHVGDWGTVVALARSGLSSPLTSSVGRLFDAVSAIAGIRESINYEGQAAIELEQLADPAEGSAYELTVHEGEPFQICWKDLIRAVALDLAAGTGTPAVAARFHNALAAMVVAACRRARETSGLSLVALSGGVFQNVLLTERAAGDLADAGFRVLTHSRVPTNDGGISLGQAAVAGALRH
ncbi:MAG TPA: carbamoyltransferase HypF [Acidimicrobiales bacterium]|nr:carbamoyltransferase HypF [Acidimicrobiales bacterium]